MAENIPGGQGGRENFFLRGTVLGVFLLTEFLIWKGLGSDSAAELDQV